MKACRAMQLKSEVLCLRSRGCSFCTLPDWRALLARSMHTALSTIVVKSAKYTRATAEFLRNALLRAARVVGSALGSRLGSVTTRDSI